MNKVEISEAVKYVGVDDHEIDLFESQYEVPNGVSYNSYVILDDKITIMDTVDAHKTEEWLSNLKEVLGEKVPTYLVISHLEPDHSGSIKALLNVYPKLTLIGNAKTFQMLPNFLESSQEQVTVKEGECVSLGAHTLQFFMAPMVHWPEVMVTYEQSEQLLFTADGFGKFGTLDIEEDWACEARRYYFNIVGKYGMPVQTLLKKAAGLTIQKILPLHGPVLDENLSYYIEKYNTWSSYAPEDHGVLVAYASIHGNTAEAAKLMAKELKEAGVKKVAITDLSRDDQAEAVEDAFRYDRMVLAAASYDGGVFPPMEEFLMHLRAKTYQNRTVAIIENGSWAPTASRVMKEYLGAMKNITVLETEVKMISTVKPETKEAIKELAKELAAL
ncbi:MAG: FprA family A-type flavoprotein [Lachnospiraceae bacterium]|nr:FprA family A-type flavoprotein [Lachnospiraceae bacterium]